MLKPVNQVRAMLAAMFLTALPTHAELVTPLIPAPAALSAGPGVTLEKVYTFEPSPSGADDPTLLGVQANLWTEHVVTTEQAERLLLPRLCALAEVAWSPRESRDFKDFSVRIPAHLAKLRAQGYRVFGDK